MAIYNNRVTQICGYTWKINKTCQRFLLLVNKIVLKIFQNSTTSVEKNFV